MRKLLTLALAAMRVCGALVTGAFAEEEGLYQYEVKADGTARIVYIDSSYTSLEGVYVGKEIEKLPNVTSATFYSKDEAFEQYRETLGDSLFERIEDNPLPDSIIVVMDDLSKYDETVAEIFAPGDTGRGFGIRNVHRRIRMLYGAEYGVRSEEGKGTTFWFELPRAPKPEDDE